MLFDPFSWIVIILVYGASADVINILTRNFLADQNILYKVVVAHSVVYLALLVKAHMKNLVKNQ